MKRKRTIFIVSIGVVAITFLIIAIISSNLWHTLKVGDYNSYLWVFKKSEHQYIDTFNNGGGFGKNDSYYTYLYNKHVSIFIWEFKQLANVELNEIGFHLDSTIKNVDFSMFSQIQEQSRVTPEIKTTLRYKVEKAFNINILGSIEFVESIRPSNYIGFYGKVNKITFSYKDNGVHFTKFEWINNTKTLFLTCKKDKRFYIVMFNSEYDFDESILNILDI